MEIVDTFDTLTGNQVRLQIKYQSRDSIIINLQNINYKSDRRKKVKMILFLLACYIFYRAALPFKIAVDCIFVCFLLLYIYQIFNLIKYETVKYFQDFALQTSTVYFLNRKANFFIPANLINDVVINEVICDLKIMYILAFCTKGEDIKPIIPVFHELRPTVDCLEIIYKELKAKLDPN